jgi:hypothetical protein
MQLILAITGERPMLQHNARLANPINAYTQRLRSITGKRKKTDEDLVDIMSIEARGGCWETPDGYLGVPTAAVWRSIFDAAKAYKLGQDVKRALLMGDAVEPLLVNGKKVTCDEFLRDTANIDYRSVKVGTSRTMRARPIIQAGWQTTHTFELLADVIDPRNLAPVIQRAGRLVGLGDWRPTYGTFTAEVSSVA